MIATVYPLADVARRVTGPAANVEWLVERGQSLRGLPITPELRNRLNVADLILTGGGVDEPWAVEGFDQPYRAPHIIRLDLMPSAHETGATSQLWLDPAVVKEAAREMIHRIVLLRPKVDEAPLRQNDEAFEAELDAMLAGMRPRLQKLATRRVLVLNDDFAALLHPFSIDQVCPISASPLHLTDDDLRRLREAVQTEHVNTLLLSAEAPQAVADDLGDRLGVQVLTIDSLGTSAVTGHNTYIELLRYDLEQLTRIR